MRPLDIRDRSPLRQIDEELAPAWVIRDTQLPGPSKNTLPNVNRSGVLQQVRDRSLGEGRDRDASDELITVSRSIG